jgi:membrane protease YdiL (CAAX protease family)
MIWAAAEYLLLHFFSSNISIVLSIPQGVSVLTIIGYFLLNVLFLLTLNSLKEELVFRAYPISQFDDYPQLMIPIIILVSLVFASVHHILAPFALDDFVSRFTIALVLSFVFYRWRSIWLIAGIHNGLNLFVYLTGGNYKMGGLLKLSMENDPSQGVSIAIDLGLAIIFILLFNFIWKKENQNNKMLLRIKHPKV